MDSAHFVDEFADALIVVTPAGSVVSWSRGAERMFGYTSAEAIGRSLCDVVGQPAAQDERRAWDAASRSERSISYEAVRRHKSGTPIHVEAIVRAVRSGGATVEYLAISKVDVTRLRHLREATVLEARYRGLLEAAPDAMVIVNQAGHIVLATNQTLKLFGYPREEVLGEPVEMLVPARFRAAHPALRDGYFDDPRPRPMGAGVDLAGLRKDGTEFPAEISLSPIRTDDGSVLVTAAIRDVTSRKKVEAKFRGLLEAAPDAIVIVDRTGRIVLVNSQTERIFGYARTELVGQKIETLVPDRLRDCHPGYRDTYFADPRVRSMGAGLELSARRKDGTEFAAEISLSPMESEDDLLVTAAIRDVTDRQQQNRRVQEASRMKSEFLANMSHELRTPLNAIIGFAKLMHSGTVGPVPENHREFLGDILTSASHLLQLINDVLDLSKVEAGKMEFRPERCDLTALLKQSVETMRTLASQRRIELVFDFTPEIDSVHLDPSRFKQVLFNFLSNAIKFTEEGGQVTIRTLPEGPDRFRLEVQDTGVGLDAAEIARLFVDFQQLDGGTGKRHQGTGLGLSLTKRIVNAQGGEVGVVSEKGRGSTFFAVLPRGDGRVRAAGAGRRRVLIVDDNAPDLRLAQAALHAAGYDIDGTTDPAAALDALASALPDAVVVDLLMPKFDGFEFIERLRSIAAARQLPLVVWTVKDLTEGELQRLRRCDAMMVRKGHGGVESLVGTLGAHLP
jgi:PAS domain S-box-containing protein